METMSKETIREILSQLPWLSEPYWRIEALKHADEEFLPRIREMLLDPEENYQVHLSAAQALLRLGNTEFVESIAYSTEPQHPSTRVAAAQALGEHYAPTPDIIHRTLCDVWMGNSQHSDDLKRNYLKILSEVIQQLQGVKDTQFINTIFDTLLCLVDFQREHPRVLEIVIDILIGLQADESASIFATAFEQCKDDIVRSLIYIKAIGRAGDPKYFERIANYPDYVRARHPHAYTDALASVISAAGRLNQYEWLLEINRQRDLLSARPAWLGALPIRASQNSFKVKSKQFRGKIVFIGWVYGELGRNGRKYLMLSEVRVFENSFFSF
jgi:hypothetical protein